MSDDRPGIFTTLRVRHGGAWFWARHVARLEAGARFLGLPPAPPPEELAAATAAAAGGLDDVRVRITLPPSGGPRVEARPYVPPRRPWRLGAVWASPDVDTAHHKTTARDGYERARSLARGADDALLVRRDGAVLEATVANVFFVERGALLTPPASEPLLPGVAREHVLRVARTLGIEAREERITLARAAGASGCFVTNALFVLHPVAAIEGLATFEVPGLVRDLCRELIPPKGAVRIIHAS